MADKLSWLKNKPGEGAKAAKEPAKRQLVRPKCAQR